MFFGFFFYNLSLIWCLEWLLVQDITAANHQVVDADPLKRLLTNEETI